MKPGPRFIQALEFAARAHADQTRKGSETAYIAHPLAVAAIVIENGGDEDQAIAALLHDAIEDQGGKSMAGRIEQKFGRRVVKIVWACSDASEKPKPPWRERKEQAVKEIASAGPEVLLVEIADKLHNARAILFDYRQEGELLWDRFVGGREGTLWYYRAMADSFLKNFDHPLAAELDRTVREIESLAREKE